MSERGAFPINIRNATASDLDAVIRLDMDTTGTEKRAYWQEAFARHVAPPYNGRLFLIAEKDGVAVGFIVAETRAWEFGSPPCGWVFALNVATELREHGIASVLFNQLCARLRLAGVDTLRTMVAITNKVNLSFFRSMGMTSGPYIELEKRLE
ncbi:MAG: GNAT family N-acetyltransferase [Gammaproteobacteria bacterium RIFCSPLOWO2_02_FULL_61_13]|nr:MAG: GNAT family N-acetyltransferase [Gammaproteobacteria bacterium RIFCSPLOWO2_02_FULL_61_13]